jgi:2'-5' RNA ligase
MMRLFIALETPASVRDEIGRVRDDLASAGADVRWEPNARLHCTVKFLGDTRSENVPRIVDALTDLSRQIPAFRVVYSGLGCFPGRRDPRVIWVGMRDPDGGVGALAESIEETMERLGYTRETRTFHPHVTLGRVRGRLGISGLLGRMETLTFESRPVLLPVLHLIQSELRPTGSVYTTLQMFPFAG